MAKKANIEKRKKKRRDEGAIARQRKRSHEAVRAFFDVHPNGMALIASGFTPRDRMNRLIELIDSEDERVSLAALKEFRTMFGDILEKSGGVERQTAQMLSEDGRFSAKKSASVLRTRLLSDVPADGKDYRSHVYEPMTDDQLRETERTAGDGKVQRPALPEGVPSPTPVQEMVHEVRDSE